VTVGAVFVTGVSGSGKTTVGSALAAALGVGFVDADDLHPQANVRKMAAGQPLTDEDRWPWLHTVGRAAAEQADRGVVVACSALRRVYRDVLVSECPQARFVQLVGSHQLLAGRVAARAHAYMPPSLLDSQLATLEPLGDDEQGVVVPVDGPAGAVVEAVRAALGV